MGEKRLAFDNGVFAAGCKGEVDGGMDRVSITAGVRGVILNLLPALAKNFRALDIVQPTVAQPRHALQSRLDIVRREPDRHAAGLHRFRFDCYVIEAREIAFVLNVILAPQPSHDFD